MIYIDDHIEEFNLREALAAVSPQRRDYALRYRQERDQRLCLAAYRLLQRALMLEYGIDGMPVFTYDSKGKPQLQGHPDIHTLPVGNLIKQNLVLMLLPVLLGIGLHYAWPKTAEKVDKVLTKLAFPLLLVLITVFYIQHRHTIMDNIGVLGLCVTALILLAIGLSSLLSRLVRNDARQRRTVVIEVGMQNAAQAISIASSPFIFANEEMAIPAILYSLMMNIVLLTYVGLVKKKKEL